MTARRFVSGAFRLIFVQTVLLFSLFSAQGIYAGTASIEGIRVRPSPERTRMVFDLGSPVEHKIFALANPDRLVIDIKDADLNAKVESLELANTPIRHIRSAVRKKDDVRVVLDLSEKVKPRSFILKPIMQYGDRLVVDLYTEEQQQPVKVNRLANRMRDVIIAVDAGHGGDDPGAIGHAGLVEKDVVLAIAERLSTLFGKEPGYRPYLVRGDDYYIGLRRRTELARKKQADIFLSIHADAFKTTEARGASVYAISQRGATSETARWLAEKENRADLIGGVGGVSLDDKDDLLAGVLLDLSMTASLVASLEMGESVLHSMKSVSRLHKTGVEQAGFAVLKSPDIPSLLIETGYISNPAEAAALATRSHRNKLARAIFYGVKRYVEKNPPPGTWLAWKKQGGDEKLVKHVIERGDTLSGIADKYRVSAESLKRINGISGDLIRIGQVLKIPTS